MAKRTSLILVLFLAPALAQALPPGDEDGEIPVKNWVSAPFWSPEGTPRGEQEPTTRSAAVVALAPAPTPLPFFAVTPCRIVNTRRASSGEFDAPALVALTERTFTLPNGPCPGLPTTAAAWSLNVTVVPAGIAAIGGYLSVYPGGGARPVVSTLNFQAGASAPPVANAAIVPAGPNGAITVFPSDATHLLIDVNGYYAPAGVTSVFGRAGEVAAASGDYTAGLVRSSPTGNLSATNVQAALGELEGEKAPVEHAHGFDAGRVVVTAPSTGLLTTDTQILWDDANDILTLNGSIRATGTKGRTVFAVSPATQWSGCTGCSISSGSYGYVTVSASTTGSKGLHFPVSLPTQLLGTSTRFVSLEVCYSTSHASNFIDITQIYQLKPPVDPVQELWDGTNRASTTATCYTVTPSAPFSVTGPLTLDLSLSFSTASENIKIGSIKVTLDEL